MTCHGYGCDKCTDGQLVLDGCPNAMCRGLGPTIEAINLFHEGLPPIAGGSLDQCSQFIDAARHYKIALEKVEADIRCRANQ